MMPSVPMGTFKEYDCENSNALLAWMNKNYKQIGTNKFIIVNGSAELFSRKELIIRAAIEGIIARQWATLEISRLSLTERNF